MTRTRRYSPPPRNRGEAKSVRDAYDRQWQAEKAEREQARKEAEQARGRQR